MARPPRTADRPHLHTYLMAAAAIVVTIVIAIWKSGSTVTSTTGDDSPIVQGNKGSVEINKK